MLMNPATDKEAMKQLFKEALSEALEERRDLLHEVFAEVLEDFALAEAIREGQQSELATRDEVFSILEGNG
jgi:signal transduction histidine kinase